MITQRTLFVVALLSFFVVALALIVVVGFALVFRCWA